MGNIGFGNDGVMTARGIYGDIARRTGGEIYIGVVGPVRTGKSTFIKKFMEQLVLPNMENEYERERARDEMPQSAAGKTVMTTEPKFVPAKAEKIKIRDGAEVSVRLVDCVGFTVRRLWQLVNHYRASRRIGDGNNEFFHKPFYKR